MYRIIIQHEPCGIRCVCIFKQLGCKLVEIFNRVIVITFSPMFLMRKESLFRTITLSQTKKNPTNLGLNQGKLVRMVPVQVVCSVTQNLLQVGRLTETIGHTMFMVGDLLRRLIFLCNVVWVPESVYVPMTRYYVPELFLL